MDSLDPVNKMRNCNFIICTTFMWPSACWASGDISVVYLVSIDMLAFIFSIYLAAKIKYVKNKIYAMASIVLLSILKGVINFKVPFVDNKISLMASTCIFVITSVYIVIHLKK